MKLPSYKIFALVVIVLFGVGDVYGVLHLEGESLTVKRCSKLFSRLQDYLIFSSFSSSFLGNIAIGVENANFALLFSRCSHHTNILVTTEFSFTLRLCIFLYVFCFAFSKSMLCEFQNTLILV